MYTSLCKYELLDRFGKLVANELTNMFDSKSRIVIPFTESMVQSLCNDHELKYENVLVTFKTYFKNSSITNDYCNLASCVFQVIVAYKCIAWHDAAYNEAFSKLLDVSTTELQKIYSEYCYDSGNSKWNPKQELLWMRTKDFLEKECNLYLCIPQPKYYTGRYVQYPRSQQLFLMADFEKYNQQFQRLGLSHEESYEFKYFSSLMFCPNSPVCTNNSLPALARNQLEIIARKIIFYCFCNWVEKEIRKRGAYNTNKKTKRTSIQDQITIRLDTKARKFSVYLNDKKQLRYEYIQDKILAKPFIYDEAYGDWGLAKKISQEDCIGVCIHPNEIESNIKVLKGGIIFKSSEDSSIVFISLSPNNWENLPPAWKSSIGSNKFFIGGIKDEDGAWLPGLLPFVLKDDGSQKNYLFIDSIRYDFCSNFFDLNVCNLQSGIHYVKLPDRSIAELKVADAVMGVDDNYGWVVEKKYPFFCSVSTGWMISGLNIGETILAQLKAKKIPYWGNNKMEQIVHRFSRLKGKIGGAE